jgi:5'-nucleotidase
MMGKPLILVTNDDGINSPGLCAAAAALEDMGDVLGGLMGEGEGGPGGAGYAHDSGLYDY